MLKVSYTSKANKQKQRNPGGPVVKNLSCNAGDTSSIPVVGTRIPHVIEQLNPCSTTTEAHAVWSLQATARESECHTKDPACCS